MSKRPRDRSLTDAIFATWRLEEVGGVSQAVAFIQLTYTASAGMREDASAI